MFCSETSYYDVVTGHSSSVFSTAALEQGSLYGYFLKTRAGASLQGVMTEPGGLLSVHISSGKWISCGPCGVMRPTGSFCGFHHVYESASEESWKNVMTAQGYIVSRPKVHKESPGIIQKRAVPYKSFDFLL